MKKTLYIHIGTHKTGTTAIQKFSVDKFEELLALDIYYPKISRPTINKISNGHHLLPWYLIGHPVPDKYYNEYHDKKSSVFPSLIEDIKSSSCQNIIISSEEFDRLNSKEIEQLKAYFDEFNIKIIVYLRRKDTYLESMYQTDVISNNEKNNISEYIKNVPIPLNYYNFITDWKNTFGEENLLINFYCKKSLKSNDIVVDFYSHLGINVEEMIQADETKKINASVPFQYIGLISMLRRMDASDDMVNSVKRIAYKMGASANRDFHFLSLEERNELAKSGLEEVKRLNLVMPDEKCFTLSDDEKNDNIKLGRFAALKQVFTDFEEYLQKNDGEK